MSNETTQVLIAGGGPSGMVAGLLLAKRGIRSIIIERNEATDLHPKAHELNARSIEILSDAGISEDEIAVEASPQEDASRVLFCRTINEEIGRIDLIDDPDRKRKYDEYLKQDLPYMNVSQSEVEKILVRHVNESPYTEIRYGQRWESMEETADGVLSFIVADDGNYTIKSGYLLGCDGAGSPVRKAVGIGVEGPAEIQRFVNAYFEIGLRDRIETSAKLYWIMHPEYAGTFVAHHMDRRWIYAAPCFVPWESPEDFTEDVLIERIRGALGFDVPGLRIKSISTWRMTAQVADAYRCGRVLLVGDAAHRFPPTGGLGMNTGIADAHNLCWKLAEVMRGHAGDALIDTYEQERRPIAVRNCAESRENYDKIFEVVESLGLSRAGMEQFVRLMRSTFMGGMPRSVRNAIRWMVTRAPLAMVGRALHAGSARDRAQAAIANQIEHFDRIGLDIGYQYEDGALLPDGTTSQAEVTQYTPSTNPGARLPHVWVERDGDRVSTLDLIAYDRITLFCPPVVAGVEGAVCADIEAIPETLRDGADAILVRPDGHVAWRGSSDSDMPGVIARILAMNEFSKETAKVGTDS